MACLTDGPVDMIDCLCPPTGVRSGTTLCTEEHKITQTYRKKVCKYMNMYKLKNKCTASSFYNIINTLSDAVNYDMIR